MPNGKFVTISGYYTYKEGKLNGIAEFYWPKTKIKAFTGIYANGLRNGNFMEFDEKGKIISNETYENGVKK